jgi:tetratricopeptide (TPR) repeat protein
LDEIDRWSFERSELLRGKDESVAGAYQQGQSIAVPRKAVNVGGGATRASAETAKHATGAIRLRAIDDEKKPLQNFESRIQNIQTKQVSAGPKDKKGEVHFENTAPGQYQVFIQKKGYITAKSQVVEIGDRGVEVSLIIPKEELLQKMEEEGRVAFEAQDYPKALEKYQAALELVPWEIPMRQNVMLSLVRLNQADKAREIARQALVYEPDEFPKKEKEIMSTVSFEEGKLYLEQQKFDKAVVSFVEALQGDPGNGQIYYGLALAYGHQGKYPEALRHIDEAIKLSPGEANYVEAKNMLLSNAKVAGEK